MKLFLDRTRAWCEGQIAARDAYIQRLCADYDYNLKVAHEKQRVIDRLQQLAERREADAAAAEGELTRLAAAHAAAAERARLLEAQHNDADARHGAEVEALRAQLHEAQRIYEQDVAARDGEAAARIADTEARARRRAADDHGRALQRAEAAEQLLQQRERRHTAEREQLEAHIAELAAQVARLEDEGRTIDGAARGDAQRAAVEKKRADALQERLESLVASHAQTEAQLRARVGELERQVSDSQRHSESAAAAAAAAAGELRLEVANLRGEAETARAAAEAARRTAAAEGAARQLERAEADALRQQHRDALDVQHQQAELRRRDTESRHQEERQAALQRQTEAEAERARLRRELDEAERRAREAAHRAERSEQQHTAAAAMLEQERAMARRDNERVRDEHLADVARWEDETQRLRAQLRTSEDARRVLEDELAATTAVGWERKALHLQEERDAAVARVAALEAENAQVREGVRRVTEDLQADPLWANAQATADRAVRLEAEVAHARNQLLELEMRAKRAEAAAAETAAQAEKQRAQHAHAVKTLVEDAATLRQELGTLTQKAARQEQQPPRLETVLPQPAPAEVHHYYHGAAISTANGTGATLPGPLPQQDRSRETHNVLHSSSFPATDAIAHGHDAAAARAAVPFFKNPFLPGGVAAPPPSGDADLDQALYEVARLRMANETQRQQLADLAAQRGAAAAKVADLSAVLAAVSREKEALAGANSVLRSTTRALESELARVRVEHHNPQPQPSQVQTTSSGLTAPPAFQLGRISPNLAAVAASSAPTGKPGPGAALTRPLSGPSSRRNSLTHRGMEPHLGLPAAGIAGRALNPAAAVAPRHHVRNYALGDYQ
jgi:hypothetical protein